MFPLFVSLFRTQPHCRPSALFFTLMLISVTGRAPVAFADGASILPAQVESSTQVLLISRPTLRVSPGGKESDATLPLEAGSYVSIGASAEDAEGIEWRKISLGGLEGWLPDAYLAPAPQRVDSSDLARIGAEPVDRWKGIDPEYEPGDLVSVGHGYDRDINYQLRKEAAAALEQMIDAAASEGIKLEVVSAYRSYEKQRSIYLGKLRRSGFGQKTVAKPGHSEHQLGTAVDLTGPGESHLLRASFGETPAGQWLLENAPQFGFAISYTKANEPLTGYAYEPWHYRYYGIPAAQAIHEAALAGAPRPGSSE